MTPKPLWIVILIGALVTLLIGGYGALRPSPGSRPALGVALVVLSLGLVLAAISQIGYRSGFPTTVVSATSVAGLVVAAAALVLATRNFLAERRRRR